MKMTYEEAVASLKNFRKRILADLVGGRVKANLDANHDTLEKYRILLEQMSIEPYVFMKVRELALAFKFKDMDIGTGEEGQISINYVGNLAEYPLNEEPVLSKRQLPQVDVYLYDIIKDIDLLRKTDTSALQSFILIQAPSGTFEESPDAENAFYDYYQMYLQDREDDVITLSNQYPAFANWVTVKGVANHFWRYLTPKGSTDYVWYHIFVLLDSGVYSDSSLTDTPPYIILHPAYVDTRPLVTINLAGHGIQSDNYGVFAHATYISRFPIVGMHKIATDWTFTSQVPLWNNEFKFTISVEPEDAGYTNPAVGEHTYQSPNDVQITAYPYSGYTFDHWEIDDVNKGSANPITVGARKDLKIKAVFVPI